MLAHKANGSSFAQQNAGTEIHDSNKALRPGRFVFAVVVFTRQIRERGNSLCAFTVQRCSPTLKHSLCATSAALGIMQINLLSALICTSFPVLSPRLPLTTTHAHTVPFFRILLLLLVFHCRSNPLKTALYERELLLAANEENDQESSCK